MTKAALVTGASKRVGREIAVHLAKSGYFVWIHSHEDRDAAEALWGQLKAMGCEAEPVYADLRDSDAIQAMFNTVAQQSQMTVLVNSASVFFPSRLDQLTSAEWDEIFSVNLKAVWQCAVEAARCTRGNGQPSVILNIADSGAYQRWANYGAYALSKSAVLTLTELLAKTLAPQVRVNSISPGLILAESAMPEEKWAQLAGKTLLQKAGDVQNLLQAVDFLLTNDYITGIDLPVDGGYRWKN